MDALFGHNALTKFATRANHRLKEHFDRWRSELPGSSGIPATTDLFGCVIDLTLRSGKRIRPALAYHTALCFEHELSKEVLLDASLSVELLQTALLIHDDIMDQDDVRRGGPSTHKELEELTGNDHLGASLGILAGTIAMALSDRLLIEAGLPDARYRAANAELVRMKYEVNFGQLLDMVGGASTEVIHRWKTASYTTMGPLRLGAAMAGAGPYRSAGLFDVGEPLGRAFQMRDDLLLSIGQLARRQETYFRGMERRGIPIHWVEGADLTTAAEELGTLIRTVDSAT